MSTRQAACDPCRRAKLACDHKQPICTRCEQSQKAHICAYRSTPFRRRKAQLPASAAEQSPRISAPSESILTTASPQRSSYPNPGFLGSSSHVAIFNQIESHRDQHENLTPPSQYSSSGSIISNSLAQHVADILKELLTTFDLAVMKDLVDFWHATGTSLALADSLVHPCAQAMDHVRTILHKHQQWHSRLVSQLLQNSALPLNSDASSTQLEFVHQFCGTNIRLETLGLFFCAVIRATFDIPFFPKLYATDSAKHKLRLYLTRLNKYSLELCLSLDCLNDIQLVFQYETFIVNSYVDGNHNLSSSRSLGDVITSIFALGYHEDMRNKPDVPAFLVELRTTAFARIYSADKNVAIFLGRPPRMSKRFCCFQVPSGQKDVGEGNHGSTDRCCPEIWPVNSKINYTSETRWSALCASIKEEILELLYSGERDSHIHTVSDLSSRAEAYWRALPDQFRLQGSLRQYSDRSPFERDFLVSARVNYLHVQFLLRFVVLARLTEPDSVIIEIAREILSLSVETILLRDHLVNSGTGLTWRIAHYGLPAAGIILLAIVDNHESTSTRKSLQSRVWQDLSVLAAEVQVGTILQQNDPNYALLTRATQTIQNFLDSVSFEKEGDGLERSTERHEMETLGEWTDRLSPDPWNLEIDFWENLAGHPFIAGTEVVL